MPDVRRAHAKSRNGCAQCKKRHTKCNEVHPRCQNCTRLDIECSFSSHDTPSPQPSDGPESALPLIDLELMFHYLTSVGLAISEADETSRVLFREKFVRLGFAHPFVLHAMLALAGVHMFAEDSSRVKMLQRASHHHMCAIRQARSHVVHHTQELSIPMFAFSSFISIYVLAEASIRPRTEEEFEAWDPLPDLVQSFHLGRGVKALLTAHWTYMKASWVGDHLQVEDSGEDLVATLDQQFPVKAMLEELIITETSSSWSANENSPKQQEILLEAVRKLFTYLAVMARYDESHSSSTKLIQMWPIDIDAGFIEMLDQREPLALIVIAYYAVLMSCRPRLWWLSRWPIVLVKHVIKTLVPRWQPYLHWPNEEVIKNMGSSMDTSDLDASSFSSATRSPKNLLRKPSIHGSFYKPGHSDP